MITQEQKNEAEAQIVAQKEPVSFVFRENSPFKIRVGKQIRAIELVLTLKESTFLPDTSYRAVIDKKQKVYIP